MITKYSTALGAYAFTFLVHFALIAILPSHELLSVVGGALFAIEAACIVIAWKMKADAMYSMVFAVYAGILGHLGAYYGIAYIRDIAMIHIAIIIVLWVFKIIFDAESRDKTGGEEDE